MLHIKIVGDSSSSGIGRGRGVYPYLLSTLYLRDIAHDIENCAVPGFTSAAANCLFHTQLVHDPIDLLVLYLGNNEATLAPHQGIYEVKEPATNKPAVPFRPILSPDKFTFTDKQPQPGCAVTAPEFYSNIESIVDTAGQRGIETVLISPVANHRFPAGLGLVNSAYFVYLDQLGAHGGPIEYNPDDKDSEQLAMAMVALQNSDPHSAIKLWNTLATSSSLAGYIARHNIACTRFYSDPKDALNKLLVLVRESSVYKPIVLWNLYTICHRTGQQDMAMRYREDAYAEDLSLYRIKDAYRQALQNITNIHNITHIDLKDVLQAGEFVDYCHPTLDGQHKIARVLDKQIRECFKNKLTQGKQRYQVRLPSPNLMDRQDTDLIDYYCIDYDLSETAITQAMHHLVTNPGLDGGEQCDPEHLSPCAHNFELVNRLHPAYSHHLDLLNQWLPRPHEMLSFPEFFMSRVLYNYLGRFEELGLENPIPANNTNDDYMLCKEDYDRMALRRTTSQLDTSITVNKDYLRDIENSIRRQLRTGNIFKVRVGYRTVTVITWYTRESFRYGTESRNGMLYERWEIDRLTEAATIGCVIAYELNHKRTLEMLADLLQGLHRLIATHEHYVAEYTQEPDAFDAGNYQQNLAQLKKEPWATF